MLASSFSDRLPGHTHTTPHHTTSHHTTSADVDSAALHYTTLYPHHITPHHTSADVDSAAASGVSALWLASGEGKSEIVDFLIKKVPIVCVCVCVCVSGLFRVIVWCSEIAEFLIKINGSVLPWNLGHLHPTL